MSVVVKFGRVPGRLQEGVVNSGVTVREALRSFGLNPNANEVVSVNGVQSSFDARVVSQNTTITLSAVVKGN